MSTLRFCWLSLVLPFVLVAGWLAPSLATAQQTLRWKFEPGDKFELSYRQDSTMTRMVQGKPVKNDTTLNLSETWNVKGVKDGVGQIEQTIDRVEMKLALPGAQSSYDSSKPDQGSGPAKTIGEALHGITLNFDLSPDGKVAHAELDDVSQQKLESDSTLKGLVSMFQAKGQSQAIEQLASVLPDKPVSKGDTWIYRASVDVPGVGAMNGTFQYKYEGTEQVEGRPLEKVSLTAKWKLDPLPGGRGSVKLNDQSTEGVIYFDNQAGRFVSSQATHKMSLELSDATATTTQEISTVSTTRLTPAK